MAINPEYMAVFDVLNELREAIIKHPAWPHDFVHAVAIVAEEAGEALKEANNINENHGNIDKLRKELLHTGATCIRALVNLPASTVMPIIEPACPVCGQAETIRMDGYFGNHLIACQGCGLARIDWSDSDQ